MFIVKKSFILDCFLFPLLNCDQLDELPCKNLCISSASHHLAAFFLIWAGLSMSSAMEVLYHEVESGGCSSGWQSSGTISVSLENT